MRKSGSRILHAEEALTGRIERPVLHGLCISYTGGASRGLEASPSRLPRDDSLPIRGLDILSVLETDDNAIFCSNTQAPDDASTQNLLAFRDSQANNSSSAVQERERGQGSKNSLRRRPGCKVSCYGNCTWAWAVRFYMEWCSDAQGGLRRSLSTLDLQSSSLNAFTK